MNSNNVQNLIRSFVPLSNFIPGFNMSTTGQNQQQPTAPPAAAPPPAPTAPPAPQPQQQQQSQQQPQQLPPNLPPQYNRPYPYMPSQTASSSCFGISKRDFYLGIAIAVFIVLTLLMLVYILTTFKCIKEKLCMLSLLITESNTENNFKNNNEIETLNYTSASKENSFNDQIILSPIPSTSQQNQPMQQQSFMVSNMNNNDSINNNKTNNSQQSNIDFVVDDVYHEDVYH